MPLWTIHHTPSSLTADDRRALATRIADGYERFGLPRFYVVTLFHETQPDNFFVGGEPSHNAVRITIDHIARHLSDQDARRRVAAWIGEIVRPFVDREGGPHWEFHVDETSEELWMINGLVPPPGGSDAEKAWARANAAAPY